MFRTAQITFRTERFGGETRTDLFRVFVVPGHFPAEHQDEEVVWSVDTFAGERCVSCFEVTDLTDRDGNWTARDWSWDEQAQDQQESVGF